MLGPLMAAPLLGLVINLPVAPSCPAQGAPVQGPVQGKVQGKGIGEAAPTLDDVVWIEGRPVKRFRRGVTYVVHFWATWVSTSRETLRLVEQLRKASDGKRVDFISVAAWSSGVTMPVEPMVEKRTDLFGHRVARDRVGNVLKRWNTALGEQSLPFAVVIDRRGKVVWTGHPFDGLAEVFAASVAGDEQALAAALAAGREAREQDKPLREQFDKAVKYDYWRKLPDLVDQMVQLRPGFNDSALAVKYMALVHQDQPEQASKLGRELVEGAFAEREARLAGLARWIATNKELKSEQRDLDLALAAARRAYDVCQGLECTVLETLATVHHERGEQAQAVAMQKLALEQTFTARERSRVAATLAGFETDLADG